MLSHDTGKYAGISGSGRSTIVIREVNARNANGTCSASRALAYQGVITSSGPGQLGG